MRKNTLAVLSLLLFVSLIGLGTRAKDVWVTAPLDFSSNTGIKTVVGPGPQELVQNIFAEGACDNISNISRIGPVDGVGYFENAQEVIGLDRGIILSTGTISNAEGPNKFSDASGNFNREGGDPDLNHLATGQVFDAVGLEFDFVPLDSFVTFRYVFASEEYCEFVGSIYNDVFGFFISGPGINGAFADNAKNVALIPGTQDFVAINSVNHLNNSNYYLGNERGEDANKCNLSAHQPVALNEMEYDGFTQPLTAMLKLNPCETYHIRLVVGDVGDFYYDSAVFLEAGSFNIGSVVSVRSSVNEEGEQAMSEGCSDGYFVFERADPSKVDLPVTVQYKISDGSTATEGEDFEPLSGIATIPVGEAGVKVPIYSLNDTLAESRESILLELDIPCACYSDSAFLYLEEAEPVEIALPIAYVCENNTTSLSPNIMGGNPPYSYQWSTGSTESSISVSSIGPETYSLTITDDCGHVGVDSTRLIVTTPPKAELSGQANICEGDTAYLKVEFTGAAPWSLGVAIDGVEQEMFEGIRENPYFLPATTAGQYAISYFRDAGCEGPFSGVGQIDVTTIDVGMDIESVSCYGEQDGRIALTVGGSSPPFTWEWLDTDNPALEREQLSAGNYQIRIFDNNGCEKVVDMEVTGPEALQEIEVDCEELNSGNLILTAKGGVPPYLYSIDGGDFVAEEAMQVLTAGNTYQITIEDATGCRLEQSLLMPAFYENMVELPEEVAVKIGGKYRFSPKLNIPESLIESIRWIPDSSFACPSCLQPEVSIVEETTFTLRLIDRFGCRGEADIRLVIDPSIDVFMPTVFSPNGDALNDRFYVMANEAQVALIRDFLIFDRWGGAIFEVHDVLPNDPDAGWDGLSRGKDLPPGVYVFYARLRLVDGSERLVEGDVLLMR
ncbi:MAG: gliding motility-associated C-terminal domain-containing protein [Saprospiraceae bacterium]|nr:gliding motility-associated C-terminal domain-containing protein [Saprospiraceae bacterium]